MANFNTLPVGLKTGTQLPLDAKSRSVSESALASLGVDDQLAFTYEEGLIVRCIQEGTNYVWRSVEAIEPITGLLPSNFTYPAGIDAGGVSYSGRIFNFFKLDYATQVQLDEKVDKVTGERLINAAEIIKLDSLENVELVNADWNSTSGPSEILNKPIIVDASTYATISYVDARDDFKVDAQTGYGLTKNNLTDALKNDYDGAVQWIIDNGNNVSTTDGDLAAHIANSGNPHFVNQAQVGLGSVDDTSDLDKPISNDTQDALDLKLDKGTYVGDAGMLDTRIEVLESVPLSNAVIEETGFSLIDQTITINAAWKWILESVSYSNPTNIIINIPLSATGKKRIEYIVPNDTNGFNRISGTETTGIATAPTLSNKGLYVTFYTVTDSIIEEVANPNVGNTPGFQEVTDVSGRTTNPISIKNKNGLNGITIHNFTLSFWKWINGVSIYSNILIDNITETYDIQLPNKLGGAEQTIAMVSDFTPYETISQVNAKNVVKLTEAKLYADGLITQIINGAPSDGDTLKELNDKIIAIQSIIGGSNPDADSIVNTVAELLSVFSTYTEGVNLVTLLAGKVDTIDIYNALDQIVSGKSLDARQGKVLKDLIDALQTVVNTKANLISPTFTGTVVLPSTTSIGSITAIIIGYLSGITSNVQTQLNAKLTAATGTINYLQKMVGTNALGNSLIQEVNGFLGIGTINTPTKSLAFGNQADREIGIEESSNTISGRDLTVRAGRTINYIPDTNFLSLNTLTVNWKGIDVDQYGNVYATNEGTKVYKQTAGVGLFVDTGSPSENWQDITVTNAGDIYCSTYYAGVYKQTGGTGSYVKQSGAVSYESYGITSTVNNNIYVTARGNDIFMQTNGTGAFIALGQTFRNWMGIDADSNGDVYAVAAGGDIYKQTGGVGAFVGLNQTSRNWCGITIAPNGNIYAGVTGGDIYVRIAGNTAFLPLNQVARTYWNMAAAPNGNIYVAVKGDNIYLQNNDTFGLPNLDGGTKSERAGTGKGAGKSWWQAWTGQKTVSGTDMQIETLRIQANEIGEVTLPSTTIEIINAEITGKQVVTKEWVVSKGLGSDPAQITITTAVSITTDTLGNLGKTQKEKNVIIDNGVNAINITVNGGTNFMASYFKGGTGTITFVQGIGRTLVLTDGTAVFNGAVGSTCILTTVGTIDYLRISNAT